MISTGSDNAVEIEPALVPTSGGDLFLLNFRPREKRPDRYLLIVPPFAEEMNKCRRMMTLLAQRAAAENFGVLSIDLSGTGESWGDFSDASYTAWLENLATAQDWIAERDAAVTALLGIRFGALLAADFTRNCPACERLLLWQPALNGKTVMAQFLRLRVAADMMTREGTPPSVSDLNTRLQNNRPVEVAGYELSPSLYTAISALQLSESLHDGGPSIDWFQVSMLGNDTISPADQRVIDDLTQRGLSIESAAMTGESFWSTTEVTICEPLIEATLEKLRER